MTRSEAIATFERRGLRLERIPPGAGNMRGGWRATLRDPHQTGEGGTVPDAIARACGGWYAQADPVAAALVAGRTQNTGE
jgi:hypothetical protein